MALEDPAFGQFAQRRGLDEGGPDAVAAGVLLPDFEEVEVSGQGVLLVEGEESVL